MPNGLVYEGVQAEPLEYSGGSAAQSSLLHCFDELLGVKHDGNSGKSSRHLTCDSELFGSQGPCSYPGAFLNRMRSYMPPAHRKLIEDISVQPSLKSFVQQQASEHLNQAFHGCVTKLLALRNYHISVVSRFITVPAARARQIRDETFEAEEEVISKAPAGLEERGTGGSSLMMFLKNVRNETKDALLSERSEEAKPKSWSWPALIERYKVDVCMYVCMCVQYMYM